MLNHPSLSMLSLRYISFIELLFVQLTSTFSFTWVLPSGSPITFFDDPPPEVALLRLFLDLPPLDQVSTEILMFQKLISLNNNHKFKNDYIFERVTFLIENSHHLRILCIESTGTALDTWIVNNILRPEAVNIGVDNLKGSKHEENRKTTKTHRNFSLKYQRMGTWYKIESDLLSCAWLIFLLFEASCEDLTMRSETELLKWIGLMFNLWYPRRAVFTS